MKYKNVDIYVIDNWLNEKKNGKGEFILKNENIKNIMEIGKMII